MALYANGRDPPIARKGEEEKADAVARARAGSQTRPPVGNHVPLDASAGASLVHLRSPLTEHDCWVTLMLISDILRNLHQGRRQRLEGNHEMAQVLREKGDGNRLLGESLKRKWNKKDAFA